MTGFQFSFFPHRESNMELLQEELDKMEMSCLQGGRCGGCRTWIQSPDMSPSCAVIPECPQALTGHVLPPWSVPILHRRTGALGGYLHVLAEPSYLEQPQEVARNIPGHVSPDPSGQKTTLSSCGVRYWVGCPHVGVVPQNLLWGASWVSLRVRSSKVGVSSPWWQLWMWDNPLGDRQGGIWDERCPEG